MRVLPSSIAGSWYPADPEALRQLLKRESAALPPVPEGAPVPNLLILPHAGYLYSAATALHGIRRLQGAHFSRVVVLAPSHRCAIRDRLVAPESAAVATPFGDIPLDEEALTRLGRALPLVRSDAVHAGEHAAQIEYPLLQYGLVDFRLVPLIVGDFSDSGRSRAAAALRTILDRDTLLVISSDFTHYGASFGFTPFDGQAAAEVRKLDLAAFDAIRKLDAPGFAALLRRTGATICGYQPLLLLLQTVPADTRFELLHYTNSAERTGESAEFVCYLCAAGYARWPEPESLTPAEQEFLLNLARRTIEYAFAHHRKLPETEYAAELTAGLRQPRGCFVTLNTRDGELRGCIGEIEARRPLAQAVVERALDAAFGDPRFLPVTPEEWPELRLEISVLTPPHPVADWSEIELGRHGIILEKAGRGAVFLPQVAPEQHWDLATTLTQLSRKAGLPPDAWREGARFSVFEALVFHES